jgi:hypothetical protein
MIVHQKITLNSTRKYHVTITWHFTNQTIADDEVVHGNTISRNIFFSIVTIIGFQVAAGRHKLQ